MKTPREILLQKHQSAEPELDRLRREMLFRKPVTTSPAQAQKRNWVAYLFAQIWRQVVLPARMIWTGLAAVWIAIIGFSMADSDSAQPSTNTTFAISEPKVIEAIHERQKLLAEFLAENTLKEPAEPPHSPLLPPRSERHLDYRTA